MRHFAIAAITLLGLCVAAGGLTAARAASETAAEPEAAGVIVKFHEGTTLAEVGVALDDAQAAPARPTTLDDVALLKPEPGQTIDDTVAALEGNPDVAYAEPDYVVYIDAVPNDTSYGSQWAYPYIGLPTAWDTTTGSTSVVVAVVDTGVDLAHPELDGNLVTGYNAITGGSANDDHGHGTHVAGTIAAESNNTTGVAGICWTCKIMPVKVLDSSGGGLMSDVAEGIDWAVANGADVINLSLGSTGSSTTVQTSVDNAWAAGVIVVAASGNSAGPVLYPAAYPNAIAVGAFDSSGARASFSNYGPELDISAPGVGILSTVLGGGYSSWSGTSMATPHVAGVAGLIIASGVTDKNAIRTKLLSTGTDAGTAGFDDYYGNGRLNAALAVADITAPSVSITSPTNGEMVSGIVTIAATATDNAGVYRVRFYIDGAYQGFDGTAPYARGWDTTTITNGAHLITVRAWDAAGNVSSDATVTVTINNADVQAPTASISSPTNGATVSGTVTIGATASDNVGIYRVRFYVDGAYQGFDTTAPYARGWDTTAVADGAHTVVVRAWDAAGNVSSDATVTVTVSNGPDTTAPSVTITSPADGATVSGTVTIAATASDDTGVYRVRFYIDGAYLGFDSAAPYARGWDTTTVADGAHTVVVRAWDAAGNVSSDATVTVTVSNGPDTTAPSVTITSPADGAAVSGTVAVAATASDNMGVYRVRFYVDGVYLGFDSAAPYARGLDTNTVANGAHTIVVRAWDAAGNVSSDATITVTVSN